LYSALRENTANALNETQCHSNRYVGRRMVVARSTCSRTVVVILSSNKIKLKHRENYS